MRLEHARGRSGAPAAAPRVRNVTRMRTGGRAPPRVVPHIGSSRESRAVHASLCLGLPAPPDPAAGRRATLVARVHPAGTCRSLCGHGAARGWSTDRFRARGRVKDDPSGVEGSECAELLRDHERRVIWKHDPTGADADRARPAGDVRDHDSGRCARDAARVVMLCKPEALVARPLGVLREVERVAQRTRHRPTLHDRGKVEDRDWRQSFVRHFGHDDTAEQISGSMVHLRP